MNHDQSEIPKPQLIELIQREAHVPAFCGPKFLCDSYAKAS